MSAKRVNWAYLLEENYDENLQRHVDELGQTESGRLIHNWIANTFEDDLPLDFEVECENGRADALDDDVVYEFKSKHPNVFHDKPPYGRDIKQVEKYLEAEDLEAEYGVLVYVNRGDLSEVQEYLVNGTVEKL